MWALTWSVITVCMMAGAQGAAMRGPSGLLQDTAQTRTDDLTCVGACVGLPDDYYHACMGEWQCHHFILCKDEIVQYLFSCGNARVWDDKKKDCFVTSATCPSTDSSFQTTERPSHSTKVETVGYHSNPPPVTDNTPHIFTEATSKLEDITSLPDTWTSSNGHERTGSTKGPFIGATSMDEETNDSSSLADTRTTSMEREMTESPNTVSSTIRVIPNEDRKTGNMYVTTQRTQQMPSKCLPSCAGQRNGAYQSCQGCNVYATCSAGRLYNKICPARLVWDDEIKRCEYTSSTCP